MADDGRKKKERELERLTFRSTEAKTVYLDKHGNPVGMPAAGKEGPKDAERESPSLSGN